MNITLRPENEADHSSVAGVIIDAFKEIAYSNKREQLMVDRLRKSGSFVPELSIVAETDTGELVGHILLTRVTIQNNYHSWDGLILAPLSVKLAYQNTGVGGRLVAESHAIATALGYKFIVVIGHANYYPKFGYQVLSRYNIAMPIKVAAENCMGIALVENAFSGISGTVKFSDEFLE